MTLSQNMLQGHCISIRISTGLALGSASASTFYTFDIRVHTSAFYPCRLSYSLNCLFLLQLWGHLTSNIRQTLIFTKRHILVDHNYLKTRGISVTLKILYPVSQLVIPPYLDNSKSLQDPRGQFRFPLFRVLSWRKNLGFKEKVYRV